TLNRWEHACHGGGSPGAKHVHIGRSWPAQIAKITIHKESNTTRSSPANGLRVYVNGVKVYESLSPPAVVTQEIDFDPPITGGSVIVSSIAGSNNCGDAAYSRIHFVEICPP